MSTRKEYRDKNKERISAQQKEWYQRNRERVRAEQREYYIRSWKKIMLKSAEQRAAKLGLPFSLDLEDITAPELCPYLHIPLVVGQGAITPNSPTLDKIMPELGYVKGNVQVISNLANSMKASATLDQMLTFAESVIRLHGGS